MMGWSDLQSAVERYPYFHKEGDDIVCTYFGRDVAAARPDGVVIVNIDDPETNVPARRALNDFLGILTDWSVAVKLMRDRLLPTWELAERGQSWRGIVEVGHGPVPFRLTEDGVTTDGFDTPEWDAYLARMNGWKELLPAEPLYKVMLRAGVETDRLVTPWAWCPCRVGQKLTAKGSLMACRRGVHAARAEEVAYWFHASDGVYRYEYPVIHHVTAESVAYDTPYDTTGKVIARAIRLGSRVHPELAKALCITRLPDD